MVWISVGSNSEAAFNILEKNTINIYPLYAKQYINGEWINVEAMSYQDGEWVAWFDGYLFNNGKVSSMITEWKSNKNDNTLCLAIGEQIIATAENYGTLDFYPLPAMDLTNYKTFVVDIVVDRFESGYPNYIYILKKGTTEHQASSFVNNTTRQTVEIDISSFTGEYYCGIVVTSWRGAKTTATIYSMRLIQ